MMRSINKEKEPDLYSRWYIYYPFNIILLGLSILFLGMSYSKYKPSSGFALLLINTYVDWVLVAVFSLAIIIRLITDFWRFKVFRYILSLVIVVTAMVASALFIVSLPTNIVIILAALIVAFSVSR
ncbi:hypothetical protein O5O45_31890 [Hahella aquimaris]|uniref:hypothetical protein n=1 Tax=Hahella sp. HNIBRBA332 TaxID=3015983 RepID=UPI00273BEB46|nr:hypothetical protein [Hahella sp. HNIBRBA332]WLQ14321.1 hypothetical protein O5O45_31890 [Hahella sp. HNIBRBA332]